MHNMTFSDVKKILMCEILEDDTQETPFLDTNNNVKSKQIEIRDLKTRKELEDGVDSILNSDNKNKDAIVIATLHKSFKKE